MGTLGLELQQVVNTMWALGGNPGPLQDQQVLLTIELSLQASWNHTWEVHCWRCSCECSLRRMRPCCYECRKHFTLVMWIKLLSFAYCGESSSSFLEVGGRETLWSGLLQAASDCCLPEDLWDHSSQSLSPDLRLSQAPQLSCIYSLGAHRATLRQEVGNWASEVFCASGLHIA